MAQPGVVMRWHRNILERRHVLENETARQKGAPLNFRHARPWARSAVSTPATPRIRPSLKDG
jgi:hypothetical protein